MNYFKSLSIALFLILIHLGRISASENEPWAKNLMTGITYTDLQQAINEANSEDFLVFHGTFIGNFVILKSLTIQGIGKAILDGNQTGSVISIGDDQTINVAILDMTIRNGYSDVGGGIAIYSGNTVLGNLKIKHNTATDVGGGVFDVSEGALAIYDSKIHHNDAVSGGGVFLVYLNAAIESSEIYENSVTAVGGGIATYYCNLGISYTNILDNSSVSNPESLGGGIYLQQTNTSLDHVKIKDNEADYGGGIFAAGFNSIIANTLELEKNTARSLGGGIFIDSGLLKFISSKIEHNKAGDNGGGFWVEASSTYFQLEVTEVEHNSPNNIAYE